MRWSPFRLSCCQTNEIVNKRICPSSGAVIAGEISLLLENGVCGGEDAILSDPRSFRRPPGYNIQARALARNLESSTLAGLQTNCGRAFLLFSAKRSSGVGFLPVSCS
jgi:hypothetical protein